LSAGWSYRGKLRVDELELKHRIAKGEDLHTEFKSALPDGFALSKSIVCFANTEGGQLVVGVGDTGEIFDVGELDQCMRAIDEEALNRCDPPVTVVQEIVKIGQKRVLVANIPRGTQRPYRTASGQYYIRSSNRCRQASREELLRLFQTTESLFFDESIIFRATMSDLSFDSFGEFLRVFLGIKAADDELKNYLVNLRLVIEDRPSLAGLLFFGKKPQNFIPEARLVAAHIPGTDVSIPPADSKQISGRIPELIDDAGRFLRLYLRQEHKIDGLESEIKPEVPEAAWREALVNSVAHRDYTISAPIRLIVFKDRVEFRTPGKLPNTVTIERIRLGGAHVLRNPTIYNLLARMGLVTDLRSGVRRIIRMIREHFNKEILLEETDTEFVLTIPRKQG
jgi:ATP-dependent DNA helicase RecG